jgi:hypothetical protein
MLQQLNLSLERKLYQKQQQLAESNWQQIVHQHVVRVAVVLAFAIPNDFIYQRLDPYSTVLDIPPHIIRTMEYIWNAKGELVDEYFLYNKPDLKKTSGCYFYFNKERDLDDHITTYLSGRNDIIELQHEYDTRVYDPKGGVKTMDYIPPFRTIQKDG